jgi:hypothetical protein
MAMSGKAAKDPVAIATDGLGRTDISELVPDAKRIRTRLKGSAREARSKKKLVAAMTRVLMQDSDKLHVWINKTAESNPGKAAALYIALLEFSTPKQARVEQIGTVNHQVSHFVAVTEREKPPAGYLGGKEVIEGELQK